MGEKDLRFGEKNFLIFFSFFFDKSLTTATESDIILHNMFT